MKNAIAILLVALSLAACDDEQPASTPTPSPKPTPQVTWNTIMDEAIKHADETLAKSKAERATPQPSGTPVELSDDWTPVENDDEK
jgi:hypothetical protein